VNGNGTGPLNAAHPGAPRAAMPSFTPSFTATPNGAPARNGQGYPAQPPAPSGPQAYPSAPAYQAARAYPAATGGYPPPGQQSPAAPAAQSADSYGRDSYGAESYGTGGYQEYPQETAQPGYWDGDHQRPGGNWP
jgi:hypothetical protein